MPSMRLTQAPVFHGYSLSFWVEMETEARRHRDRESALASPHIEVRSAEFDAPIERRRRGSARFDRRSNSSSDRNQSARRVDVGCVPTISGCWSITRWMWRA